MGQVLFDVEFSTGKKIKLMDDGSIIIIETAKGTLAELSEKEKAEFVQYVIEKKGNK